MTYFAKNLKELRRKNIVSQQMLASAVGKGQSTIGNWENGRTEPSMAELIVIADFFGVSIEALVLESLESLPPQTVLVHLRALDAKTRRILQQLEGCDPEEVQTDEMSTNGDTVSSLQNLCTVLNVKLSRI